MEWSSAGDGDGDEGGPRSEGDAGAEPPLVVEGVPPDSSSLRAPVLDRGDESPVVDVEPSEEPLPSPSPVKKSGEDLDAVRSDSNSSAAADADASSPEEASENGSDSAASPAKSDVAPPDSPNIDDETFPAYTAAEAKDARLGDSADADVFASNELTAQLPGGTGGTAGGAAPATPATPGTPRDEAVRRLKDARLARRRAMRSDAPPSPATPPSPRSPGITWRVGTAKLPDALRVPLIPANVGGGGGNALEANVETTTKFTSVPAPLTKPAGTAEAAAAAAARRRASDAVGEEKKEKARKDSAAFIAAAVKRAAAAAEKEAELAKREEAKKRDSSRDGGGGGEKGAAAAGRRFLRGDDLKYVPPDRITMDASGAGGGIGPGVARFGGWDTASSIESSDLEDDVDFDSRTAGAGADAAIWAR